MLLKNRGISVDFIELSVLSTSVSLLFQGMVNLCSGKCLSTNDTVDLICINFIFFNVRNSDSLK